MMVSEAMVDAAARADAAYAGRTFDALASADKVRFTERAKLMLEAALSTDAEPVAEIIAQRDALIAAGLKCCDGTPNPNLRPFDLAMSFIDSTNTARKAADSLWQEYKAELEALRAAPPAPAVAVKALDWSRTITDYGQSLKAYDPFGRQAYHIRVEDGTTEEDIAKAKAEKQADYESRIRSTLSAQVQDVVGWQTRRPQQFLDKYPDYSEYVMRLHETEREARIAGLPNSAMVNGNFPEDAIASVTVRAVFAAAPAAKQATP